MNKLLYVLKKKNQKGQSLAEYGLILALVAVFCIAALTLMGNSISRVMNNMSVYINNAASTAPGTMAGG